MKLQEHGQEKYGNELVFASSREAGWRGVALEHRRHPKKFLSSFEVDHFEIGIATATHPDCVVSRTGDRLRQHTRVEPGTIWFCPTGVLEEDIDISHWHDVLHVYIPRERFEELSETRGGAPNRPEAVRYLGGIFDERLRQAGLLLLQELNAPGSAGSLRVDVLTLALTECLVDRHSSEVRYGRAAEGRHRLDEKRLRRVLDFMAANLDRDIALDDLARIACVSAFHFSRVFADTVGVPPHRYLSHLRLERAKTLLALGKTSIVEIALTSRFASQSSFTRAFRRATGSTPMAFVQAPRRS